MDLASFVKREAYIKKEAIYATLIDTDTHATEFITQ